MVGLYLSRRTNYRLIAMLRPSKKHTVPPVKLDEDFNEESMNNKNQTDANSPGGPVAVFIGPNGRDRAEVYVGLSLDGFAKYRNVSETLPTVKIQFFTPPVVTCDARNKSTYDEGSNMPVSIQVVNTAVIVRIS